MADNLRLIVSDDDPTPPSSPKKTKIQISDLEFHEQLGRGAYGTVFKVTFKEPHLNVKEAAAKRVTEDDMREEAEVMRDLDHPNIVQLYGVLDDHMGTKILLLEYAPYGTISDYLTQHQASRVSLGLLKKWARESALALLYLHKKRILHRDLKASNALLFEDNVLKLSDFGLAREMGESETTSTAKGTWRYMAPEIHTDNHFSFNSDIYSYGMLVLEIGTGKPPFDDVDLPAHVVFIVATENAKPTIPSYLPDALRELLLRCWNGNPKERPRLEEALEVINGIVEKRREEPVEVYPDHIQMVEQPKRNNDQYADDSSEVSLDERNSGVPSKEPSKQVKDDHEPLNCPRQRCTPKAIIALVGLLGALVAVGIVLAFVLPKSDSIIPTASTSIFPLQTTGITADTTVTQETTTTEAGRVTPIISTTNAPGDSGTIHKYVFTVPTLLLSGYSPHVFITTPSRDAVKVNLSIPWLNQETSHTIDRDHEADITLLNGFRLNRGDQKQNRTGIVSSSEEVDVHVVDTGIIESEIFTVYSSSRIGTVYYVATYIQPGIVITDESTDHSFFCVSAISPDTVVSVKKPYQQNTTTYHLKEHESYRFDGRIGEDLSGTRIESNRPVAVIAGGVAAIGHTGNGDGALLEQLPPFSSWGQKHVLAPFLLAKGFVYRIYAGPVRTFLNFSDTTGVFIPPESFYEGTSDKVLTLTSDQPVMVSQYIVGSARFIGSYFESMLIIPPVTSYTSNVTFAVFKGTVDAYTSFINVVVRCAYVDGLLLDNQTAFWDDQLSSDDNDMCCVRKATHIGEHCVEHRNPNAHFFVYIYAICDGRCFSSYVYSASDAYFKVVTTTTTGLTTKETVTTEAATRATQIVSTTNAPGGRREE